MSLKKSAQGENVKIQLVSAKKQRSSVCHKLNPFNPGTTETRSIPMSPGSGGGSKKVLESSAHVWQKNFSLQIQNAQILPKETNEKIKKESSVPISQGQTGAGEETPPGITTPKEGWNFDATRVRGFTVGNSTFKGS